MFHVKHLLYDMPPQDGFKEGYLS